MRARVRGSGLRQAKSRVPEVPEQETGAAALRVCRLGHGRGGDSVVEVRAGTVWSMRRRSRGGGLLAQRSRLSPLFSIESVWCVTDVTFRFEAFLVMIRLNRGLDSGAEMDRRKERRLDLELPVRIWGMDRMARPFAKIVRVRNLSDHEAILIGVRVPTGGVL